MAFFQRKDGKRVVVYLTQDGRQKALPRELTQHLDTEPDHNVEFWIHEWLRKNGQVVPVAPKTVADAAIVALVDQFSAFQLQQGRSKKTVSGHKHNLLTHVLPYFTIVEKLPEPNYWAAKGPKLLNYLLETKQLSPRLINVCNVAMRRFWKWMEEEAIVTAPLRLRNAPSPRKETPLKFTVSATDVLAYRYLSAELRLMALIGFGFSLRPQELVALRPRDFLAGSFAAKLECCQVMARYKLFGRLAVNIHRQRVGNEFSTPKAGSKGFVACFDERIARAIIEKIKSLNPDELLFPYRLDHYYKTWRKSGYQGLTLKDLRRSSIYHLAHHCGLDFSALKSHARHADPSTTALYIRRPEEDAGEGVRLDLDA